MKAKELMIGDWVICNYYADKSFYMQFGLGDFAKYGFEFCDPVPLTPEILEKNGFEWHNKEAKFFPNTWCYGEFMLEPIVDGKLFLIVSRSDYHDEETNYTPFTIKYVHELQHALRLCGIDKEIKMEA